MRYLKYFRESNSESPDTEEIVRICEEWKITPSKIHPDGTVDVNGNVNLDSFSCTQLHGVKTNLYKLPIKFGVIGGDFYSTFHEKISTLEGFPHTVHGSFKFLTKSKKFVNLIGGPRYVGGAYDISNCKITSLEGMAEYIGGNVLLSGTKIRNLKGAPKELKAGLYAGSTLLTNLEGCPEIIGGTLYVGDQIKSLVGMPKSVESLRIFSQSIWDPTGLRDSDCQTLSFPRDRITKAISPLCELIDLFSGEFESYNDLPIERKIETTERFKESLDYNYIRGNDHNPALDLFRFKEALSEFGLDISDKLSPDGLMKGYKFLDEWGVVVNFDGIPI